jgi:hypothetical protein
MVVMGVPPPQRHRPRRRARCRWARATACFSTAVPSCTGGTTPMGTPPAPIGARLSAIWHGMAPQSANCPPPAIPCAPAPLTDSSARPWRAVPPCRAPPPRGAPAAADTQFTMLLLHYVDATFPMADCQAAEVRSEAPGSSSHSSTLCTLQEPWRSPSADSSGSGGGGGDSDSTAATVTGGGAQRAQQQQQQRRQPGSAWWWPFGTRQPPPPPPPHRAAPARSHRGSCDPNALCTEVWTTAAAGATARQREKTMDAAARDPSTDGVGQILATTTIPEQHWAGVGGEGVGGEGVGGEGVGGEGGRPHLAEGQRYLLYSPCVVTVRGWLAPPLPPGPRLCRFDWGFPAQRLGSCHVSRG